MYYSEDIVEEVRMKNDIVDVISGYVNCRKREVLISGFVRFTVKSPSFSVSRDKQMYYCFGCRAEAMSLHLLWNMRIIRLWKH